MKLIFFHFLPGWAHTVRISRLDDKRREIQTDESGALLPTWRHRIRLEGISETQCRHTDEIEYKAGLLTPLIWLYAQGLYRYRQLQAKRLMKRCRTLRKTP